MKRVLIILNPFAGTKQANKYLVDIIDIFCRAGYETVVTTEKRGMEPNLPVKDVRILIWSLYRRRRNV